MIPHRTVIAINHERVCASDCEGCAAGTPGAFLGAPRPSARKRGGSRSRAELSRELRAAHEEIARLRAMLTLEGDPK